MRFVRHLGTEDGTGQLRGSVSLAWQSRGQPDIRSATYTFQRWDE